jgi:hypothetical protein
MPHLRTKAWANGLVKPGRNEARMHPRHMPPGSVGPIFRKRRCQFRQAGVAQTPGCMAISGDESRHHGCMVGRRPVQRMARAYSFLDARVGIISLRRCDISLWSKKFSRVLEMHCRQATFAISRLARPFASQSGLSAQGNQADRVIKTIDPMGVRW